MIKRELLSESPESVRHIVINVIAQLFKLGANIVMVYMISHFIRLAYLGETIEISDILLRAGVILVCAAVQYATAQHP